MGYKKDKKPSLKELNKQAIGSLMANERFIFGIFMKMGVMKQSKDKEGRMSFSVIDSKITRLANFIEVLDREEELRLKQMVKKRKLNNE